MPLTSDGLIASPIEPAVVAAGPEPDPDLALALVPVFDLIDKALWGSPAGKHYLAKRIVPLIPPHHTYVEPFAGGAAVFFEKPPSAVEVLADRDPDIAFALRFVKSLTAAQTAALRRMSWKGDADHYRKLRVAKPTDPVDRFYRFAYMAQFSFNKLRDRATMSSKLQGHESKFMDRLAKWGPRIRKVIVRDGDYEKPIREFDGANTFHFLDPPYPGYNAGVGHAEFDEKRFRRVLQTIKGKFFVTYGIRGGTEKDLFRGFKTQRWRHISSVGSGPGKGMRKSVTLIAANYDLTRVPKAARADSLPSIKMPDPKFLIERLRDHKFAGLLSAIDRSGRVGTEQVLVNERVKEGEPSLAWGVVRMGDGIRVRSVAALAGEHLSGLDELTRREFVGRERAGEGPFWLYPLHLIQAFDPPRELDEAPPGRRFGSTVPVPKSDGEFLDRVQPMRLASATPERLHRLDAMLHEFFSRHFAGNDLTTLDGVTREDVVNAHVFVVQELERRGLPHAATDELTTETHALEHQKRDTAPVNPSGEKSDGPEITLPEVLALYQKPIVLSRDAVVLVGSVANNGRSRNDVDVVIRDAALAESLQHVTRFRIGRAAPPGISGRISFHSDEEYPSGVFTDHVPLYDLVLVPREDRGVVRMQMDKQGDPMLDLPRPGPRPMVAQAHFRGKSLHLDFRFAADDRAGRGYLIGWTLSAQKAGEITEPVETHAEAQRITAGWTPEKGNQFLKPALAPARLFAATKARQPLVWLGVDGPIAPGSVGATREEAGFFHTLASTKRTGMHVEWGVQEPFFHEYFLVGNPPGLAGSLIFRQLVGGDGGERDTTEEDAGRVTPPGEAFWTATWAKNPLPSILRHRSVERRRMPPTGRSWLPQDLEQIIPKEFRYWEETKPDQARAKRDALVESKFLTEENVRVVNGHFRRVVTKTSVFIPRTDASEKRGGLGVAQVCKYCTGDATKALIWADGRAYVPVCDAHEAKARAAIAANDDAVLRVARLPQRNAKQNPPHRLPGESVPECVRRKIRLLIREGMPPDQAVAAAHRMCESGGVRKQPRTVKFTLSWQFFKGQEVIREGPTKQHWWLVLDDPSGPGVRAWKLQSNPSEERGKITAIADPQRDKALLSLSGGQAPGTRFNDTKNTDSTIEIMDRGEAQLLEDRDGFVKMQFMGKVLRGPRALVQEERGSDIWSLQASAPGKPLGKADPSRFVPVPGIKDRTGLAPIARFTPMKPTDRPGTVFFNVPDALRQFASAATFKDGLFVEPKWNGFRVVLEKKGDDILIFFEDVKRDRSIVLPGLAKEIRGIPGDFILDGELIDTDEHGGAMPRRTLTRFAAPSTPQDDSRVKVHVFHILYRNGRNLTDKPLTEIRNELESFFKDQKFSHLVLSPSRLLRAPDELPKAVEWASEFSGSEGAMFKMALSTYSLGGETDSWAKLKLARTVNAVVLELVPVRHAETKQPIPGVFNLVGGAGPLTSEQEKTWDPDAVAEVGGRKYAVLGRTFNTAEPAKVGDIVEVSIIELRSDARDPSKQSLTWFQPRVISLLPQRSQPDSVQTVLNQLKDGEVQKFDIEDPRTIRVVKADAANEEERFVLGVVLEPETEDSQGDIYSADEVRKACHAFMEDSHRMGLMHQQLLGQGVTILENYVSPSDFVVRSNGQNERVRKGTWLQGLRIHDDGVWEKVKAGDLTGLSIGGSAVRVPETAKEWA